MIGRKRLRVQMHLGIRTVRTLVFLLKETYGRITAALLLKQLLYVGSSTSQRHNVTTA